MKSTLYLLVFLLVSCNNYYSFPSFSEKGNPYMIVEIPTGTNEKFEYNPHTNKFELEVINDKPRNVNYLSYPGNYGFIPSTLMDSEKGGDGDPLDALVISSTIKKGSLLEFVPVGVLMMLDNGEEDHKIIGIAINSEAVIVDCKTMQCLKENYKGIDMIIETWFKNYKGPGVIEVIGWEDEKYAMDMIRKWQKK